jgi:hypothetical protein
MRQDIYRQWMLAYFCLHPFNTLLCALSTSIGQQNYNGVFGVPPEQICRPHQFPDFSGRRIDVSRVGVTFHISCKNQCQGFGI